MNLIQRIKFWRELKRLESRARETPSPSTFVDLGQVYINLGMLDRTVKIAEDGLALFPNSEELRKLRKFAKKSQLNDRIKALRGQLNRNPLPEHYKELAACFLELGDFGAVYGACEECIRRFPDDAGVYLVLGRARLAIFYKELRAAEGIEALRCLEHVLAHEPENTKAMRLEAEVLYRIGAVIRAREVLARLLELTPDDAEARVLLQEAEERESTETDAERLFHLVERTGSLAFGPVTTPARQGSEHGGDDDFAGARGSLAHVAKLPGVRKLAYIKGGKALVKGDIRDGKDAFLKIVRMLAKSAQRAARRMDIGNFSKGTLDGPFGHICVCSYGEVVAAVLCAEGAAVEKILAELQELVAGSLFLSGGVEA